MGLGGFSSHDPSFAHWDSPLIEAVAVVFMMLAGVSFALLLRRPGAAARCACCGADTEVRAYVARAGGSALLLIVCCWRTASTTTTREALRPAAFHVVSVATTTGYARPTMRCGRVFAPVLMIFLGCFATCAGSTGGGIKMVRMLLLLKQARRELVRIIHPRVVNPVTLGGATVAARRDAARARLHADLRCQHRVG